jgi:hypothetical protein
VAVSSVVVCDALLSEPQATNESAMQPINAVANNFFIINSPLFWQIPSPGIRPVSTKGGVAVILHRL